MAEEMGTRGYERTSKQCWDKLKQLECDFRTLKDHNGRSFSNLLLRLLVAYKQHCCHHQENTRDEKFWTVEMPKTHPLEQD